MESQEDFNQRKSIYIQQKSDLVNKLRDLVDKQHKLLTEIATLRKPTRTPPEEYYYLSRSSQDRIRRILEGPEPGDCDYEIDNSKSTHEAGWTSGRIVLKTGVKWTKSIDHSLIESTKIMQDEQRYMI